MRRLAAVATERILFHFCNSTTYTYSNVCIPEVSRFYSSSTFHLMETGKNLTKAYTTGKKGAAKKQVWNPKRPKAVAEVKPSAGSDSKALDLAKPLQEMLDSKVTNSKLFARAQVRATFYPKFENEKSDQEVRNGMIQVVSSGQGVLEVSLKHSGSLFLYSGDDTGGAFAKNSYGNLYTAVGIFVLGRTLEEAWGALAAEKQREFNTYLQDNHLCVAMELVTAVLGDHGYRPLQDYVVVTAVTDLKRRPHFYSTSEVVAFCRTWRLPSNQLWLFSTKKSVLSFFSAYDALCEEGTASSVTKALDELADLSVPGTKTHTEVQGEILEGLVARVVDPKSIISMQTTLLRHPVIEKPAAIGSTDLGPGLREICAANRESEEKQIKALLQRVGANMWLNFSDWFEEESLGTDTQILTNFLQASPADISTLKLQELCHVVRTRKLPVRFKCRTNRHHKHALVDDKDSKSFRMTIHVLSDSAFRRYQSEMRKQPGLWPLYRGFFVDVDLFHTDHSTPERPECELGKKLADLDFDQTNDAENLMIKLKFLPYKLRTFLIRNGLPTLLNKGIAEYRTYYTRQMKSWGTSSSKQKELVQLLDEWAVYAREHFRDKKVQDSYLTVAEPFLEKYWKRSPKNQRLIGAAGSLVNVEQFVAYSGHDEEGEEEDMILVDKSAKASTATDLQPAESVKAKGMLVFFPGIPGSAKSVLCAEIQKISDFGYQHHLMGDLTKGKYWHILAEKRMKKPQAVTLADKNAPTEEVWKQIQTICENTEATGVPVVVDSPGTEANPFSLESLAVFMYRVLQRVDHPGKLDKNSTNPGYVLLMFYNLFNGKDRRDFEEELLARFGHLVKMPLLKAEREPMPPAILGVIQQGLSLFKKHSMKHGRLESFKGTFKDQWAAWETQLREIMMANVKYLDSVQVPLQDAINSVVGQLRAITSSGYTMHVPKDLEERSFRTFTFAAVKLPTEEIAKAIDMITSEDSRVQRYLIGKSWRQNLGKAHVTLAHKNTHGVAAVAAYGALRACPAPVQITAFLYSDKLCALEVRLNAEDGQTMVKSLNPWPHVTVWTGQGSKAKDANALPELVNQGQALRIDYPQPVNITGTVDFV